MIEDAVRARLLAVTGVTDLIGTSNTARAYHLRLPEGATLPAVTYQGISAQRFPDYDGVTALVSRRVQVDCWAVGGESAAELADEVRVALNGFSGTVASVVVNGMFLVDEDTDYEVEAQIHRRRQDYQVAYQEVTT